MRKLISISLLIFSSLNCLLAQNKLFTMEDAVLNLRTSLAPANLKQLKWVAGVNSYSYIDTLNKSEVLKIGSANKKDEKVALTLTDLNLAVNILKEKSLKSFPEITWINSNQFYFDNGGKLISYLLKEKKAALLNEYEKDAENVDVNPSTFIVAYTKDNNLYISQNKTIENVSKENNKDIVYGQTVHRSEFGITKGTYWSPKGTMLAFYRMDQSMVTDYSIVDYLNEKPAIAKNIKYPMAGGKSHEVTVGVYDIKSAKTVYLKTGDPKEQYLTNIAWSPDEKKIYMAVLNRDQNYMKLNCYDVATGILEKTLFEERDEKYVEPMHPLVFVKGSIDQFIWQSRKDGYNHLYLYTTKGEQLKQITKGNWEVTEFMGFDEKGETAFYESTETSPLERDLFAVTIKSLDKRKLSGSKGTHNGQLSSDGSFVIDHAQALDIPRQINIVNKNGTKVQTLLDATNPLKDFAVCKTQLFTIKNKNGTDLYCRMYKPWNFDSTKKYPVIVYLYGGPHAQIIQNNWITSREGWFQYMAQRGYIVFNLDNRGSEARGRDFEQATFRQFGTAEMDDQTDGVSYLRKLPYVDASRMGVHGWSFGGFMTTSLMTRRPDLFKVGVAGGPVIDWSYYEIMYTERYMDTPQTNADGYNGNSLLNYVNGLKGKLLLIHGTDDDVVVWQQSLVFLKKAIEQNKQLDYFVYPGHKHNVLGKERVHLMQKITDYFVLHL